MIRILTVLLIVALLAGSLVTVPAYSLPAGRDVLLSGAAESRPLTSLPLLPSSSTAQSPALDTVDIYGHTVPKSAVRSDFGAFSLGDELLQYNGSPQRTLVFGAGDVAALAKNSHLVGLGGNSAGFMGVAMSSGTPLPPGTGFTYAPDMPLTFDSAFDDLIASSNAAVHPGRLSGASIIRTDRVAADYGINGTGVTVAIVDTGTDFSNDDMRHAVARDAKGVPIMLDADGHGIVLTRAKYVANIDGFGNISNYPSIPDPLPHNATSYVYVNGTGVYLKTSQGKIPVYNTLYPFFGPPVLNGTASVDWKIGNSATDYIRSKSGIYRMGVEFQLSLQFGVLTLVIMPVLVVDSTTSGVYDTIVPDMSYAWYSFTVTIAGPYPETNYLIPSQTFDFTDEKPFKLGDGNEFLTYDYDKDGYADFSAGTAGARVLDIWRVIDNKTEVATAGGSNYGGIVSAKLLEPMDPAGEYFGIMYDFQGHGTSTAATVASKGSTQYDIYSNSTKYRLAGMAPGAKILPVKALWAGDTIYGWLYASGFEQQADGRWRYAGVGHKADIISNSWGVPNFPLLKYGPGYDILSVFSSALVVPDLLARGYPGTIIVDSAGNNGVGYGSVGAPNTSPFTISVGATTNNVHLQYSAFANITRFGPSAAAFDDVADFSSRGPGIFGDPKPELMAVGSYGFTPADVTVKVLQAKKNDANNDGAFALFGGTSMAAPMVAGAAALVVEDMRDRGEPVDPFEVKSRLMSTAKDLKNDPFVQGSGRVDALAAIELGRGKDGRFSAYTESTARNILLAMSPALQSYNSTLSIIDGGHSPTPALPFSSPSTLVVGDHPESRWFAGYVEQGDTSKAKIVVENPSKKELKVEMSSTIEKLVARYEVQNSTALFAIDSTHSEKKYGFAPAYYDLKELAGELPDSDLMVARVNFPFNSFLNSTELFADHLRIASVYAYDWHDGNNDGKVAFGETTMINRGGSWGTTQEVRVGDPVGKFKHAPVVGVYPVPTVFSFWRGDRLINSTSMNYTLTIEFYKRLPNPDVQLDRSQLTIPAGGSVTVGATAVARDDALPGVYYGEILVKGAKHSVLMPVSYIVTTRPVPKDVPVVISPSGSRHGPEIEGSLGLRPNGYVGGLSDMLSRYSAGDWRSYYFSVKDPTITSMSMKVSWPHNSTSINAMAFGPDGRLIASSVPAGVFQEFAGWASNDWLGTSLVSEGGAFFFSQNSGANSTTLYVPVNQTGIYAVLMHNTLFHGESLYEPVTVEAKFSTLLPDSTPPRITVELPRYISGGSNRQSVPVAIYDANPAGFSYSIDGKPMPLAKGELVLDGAGLKEGPHLLTVESADAVGHRSTFASEFIVDRTAPVADVSVLYENGTQVLAGHDIYLARGSALLWNVTDANGVAATRVTLPGGANATDAHYYEFRPDLADGQYMLAIESADETGNKLDREWKLVMDSTAPAASLWFSAGEIKGTATVGIDVKDANAKSALLVIGHKSVDVTGMKEYRLDTADLADGRYEARLVALDAAGNTSTATAAVVVANVTSLVGIAAVIGIAGGLAAGAAAAWTFAKRRSGKS